MRAAGPAEARRRALLPLAVAAALVAGVGVAAAAPPTGLSLKDAHFSFIIAARPAAGYFTLMNGSDTPRHLVGAASPGCGMLMLHRSMTTGGVAHMNMVDSATVPAHGALTFAPGGYHLMCMKPAASLRPGHRVPVTLKFRDGSSLTAEFPVQGVEGK
jgi:copper(I)-binding protein